MTPPLTCTAGVDVGGTNLRIGIVDSSGAVLDDRRTPSPDSSDALLDAIVGHVGDLRNATGMDVASIGVGIAGLIDHDGVLHYAPNLPQYLDVPLRAMLTERLDLKVVVDNDANAAAWGEVQHGAARGHDHALVFTLGTGVGGGIISDGRLLRGAHGFAGEVGHWQLDPDGPRCACGQVGHWEPFASGTGLGRAARHAAAAGSAPNVLARAGGDVDAVSAEDAADSATAGEPDGIALLDAYAHQVALGFAGLANVFDPEIIVVSGGLVSLGAVLLEPVRRAFAGHLEGAEQRPEVPIVAAALGDAAGLVGAAALAR